MRKLLIGLVSLGVALGVFLVYNGLNKSPIIKPDESSDLMAGADGNVAELDEQMGKIGDTSLGPVQKAKYITLNKTTKQVEREFGFEKLLHEARDVWEIEKPYMTIYRRNFTCYVTADKGEVKVETAVGKTTPRDATFSSNVVIHIVPEGDSSVKESFVYLDDIVFLSDRSLISTAGPVKFVSDDAQMRGTGLELIYDDQRERLEYFRIADLESLRIKTTQAAALSGGASRDGALRGDETSTPDSNTTSVSNADVTPPVTPSPAAPPTPPQVAQKQGVLYKCIVNRNVLVDAPDQMIFADQKLYLSDILWPSNSMDQSEEPNPGSGGGAQPEAASESRQSPAARAPSEPSIAAVEPAAEPNEPNAPAEQTAFITVTCDGGLILVPADSIRDIEDLAGPGRQATASDSKRNELLEADGGRTKFFAETINYNAISEDVIADGLSDLVYYTPAAKPGEANEPRSPLRVTARNGAKYFKADSRAVLEDCLCRMPQTGLSQPRDVTFVSPQITVNIPTDPTKQPDLLAAGPTKLVFYTEDANAPAGAEPTPVTVTARTQARYSGDSNQMVFEGDCRSTMLREDPNVIIEYVLLSDRLSVDLSRDANTASAGLAGGVKHLTASGRVVNLAATKTAKAGGAFAQDGAAKLLGAVELKCRQFDFDAVEQFFLADGPGLIKIVNSAPAEPNQQAGRLSLRKPCVALIDGFETLKYLIAENRIIADAGDRKMSVDYFSTVDSRQQCVRAEASHVDAILQQTALGQTDLVSLTASGGIYYEDTNNRFMGKELFYDHQSGIVTVSGDESQPCYYNGIMVEGIKYDLNTGKVEATVVAPGALQTNR